MSAVADPSSASLTADVRLSHDATAIAARIRSRRFLWIALAGLALGLAVGLTLLLRGRDPAQASDANAGEGSPEYGVSSASGGGAVTPRSAAFSGAPAITGAPAIGATTAITDAPAIGATTTSGSSASAAATGGLAGSGAGAATAPASTEAPTEPAAKPWRNPSTTGTTAPIKPPTGADPFGERRQ